MRYHVTTLNMGGWVELRGGGQYKLITCMYQKYKGGGIR